eukprot:CAMPEP_0115543874 /NCGR_PEP_ID=MMETSP0271-20121206/91795_1 /TAXON_ID=71861 /ORGANISM="Scrippsiella trochoidea, Strain CCMP3099" /LENGTH=50 /DNA_ID=CAMNT_0002977167 /DNA_START=915 /DNA_END=1064 /DNA_ORIENTATION=+
MSRITDTGSQALIPQTWMSCPETRRTITAKPSIPDVTAQPSIPDGRQTEP